MKNLDYSNIWNIAADERDTRQWQETEQKMDQADIEEGWLDYAFQQEVAASDAAAQAEIDAANAENDE